MSAATTSVRPTPTHVASTARPGWLGAQYEGYEAAADAEVCLHLPVVECDHRTFRCQVCCGHDTRG